MTWKTRVCVDCGAPTSSKRDEPRCLPCHHKARAQAATVTMPPCQGPACDRPARYSSGLCVAHRQQQQRGKPLTPLRPSPRKDGDQTPPCVGPDCTKPSFNLTHRLCLGHNTQRIKGRELTPLGATRPKRGTCDECDKPCRAKGKCSTHYKRLHPSKPKPRPGRYKPATKAQPKPEPERNPNLPASWDRPARTRKPDRTDTPDGLDVLVWEACVNLSEIPIIPAVRPKLADPDAPNLAAAMRAQLDRCGALDLADMLLGDAA